MKVLLYLAACLMSCEVAVAQQITITVKNLAIAKAALSVVNGEKVAIVDSVSAGANGKFTFTLNQRNGAGIYRLSIDKNRWIDFVNDGDDVKIETDASALFDSLNVITSESNRLYYSFLRLNKGYKTKSELLQLVLAHYPKDDPYYMTTQSTVVELQKEYSEFVSTTSQQKPASFIARYIRSTQLPVVDFNQPVEKQLAYLKSHGLDHVDFNDDGLISSDLFTSKAIEYLTYYRNPQLPKELLEKEFMVAVDTILGKAKVNTLVYKHVVEYLLDGFKKFGFDQCINYIIDQYVIKDDLCIDEKLETVLQKRLDQAKYLKIGMTAPNIISSDISGKRVELEEIQSERTLLIFYATWCPHCQTLLPQINELYKHQKVKKVEIIAVSIDTGKTAWQNYVSSNGLNWINVSDLQGWNGVAAQEYYIYATPTMFLLNDKKEIIGKPFSLDELRGVFHE